MYNYDGISSPMYMWFADNGALTCASATPNDFISGVVVEDYAENDSKYHFPYLDTPLADLAKTYPGYYDCRFITTYSGTPKSDDEYGLAASDSQVGVLVCNNLVSGRCDKRYDTMKGSAGGTVQTLFRCALE